MEHGCVAKISREVKSQLNELRKTYLNSWKIVDHLKTIGTDKPSLNGEENVSEPHGKQEMTCMWETGSWYWCCVCVCCIRVPSGWILKTIVSNLISS